MYKKLLLLLFVACNPPRQRTYLVDGNTQLSPTPSNPSITTEPTTENENPCNFSTFQYNHPLIKGFNICFHPQKDNVVVMQLESKFSSNLRLCIIPLTKVPISSSFYYEHIGPARCLASDDPKKIHQIPLQFSDSGYALHALLLVIDRYTYYNSPFTRREKAPDAFAICENKIKQGDPRYCNSFYAKKEHILISL